MTQDIYLYINVPFCLKRCPYCYCTLDFSDEDLLSWRNNSELYVEAILKETSAFSGESKRCLGISFGGGTPTVLEVPQIERILNAAMKCCASINEKAQISIETFPGTKKRGEWKSLLSMGFNRASIGAQSFDDEELRLLGRAHNTQDVYKTYDDLCAAGFENINIDLMFGLPIGDLSSWIKSVDAALELQPKHLTAYYWYPTLGSNFYIQIAEGTLEMPDRETSIEQYQYAIDAAAKQGLNRYWEFNFSRGVEYQYAIERDMFRLFPIRGFGPGAWSQEGTSLICNPSMLYSYLKDPLKRHEQKCTVEYYIMRVLMFPQGLVFKEFEHFFNKKWSFELVNEKVKKAFDLWGKNDFIEIDNDGIRFKEKTLARSSIYLAELHTRCLYLLSEELPVSASA